MRHTSVRTVVCLSVAMCFVEISGREFWRKLHSEKLHCMQFATLLVIIKDNKDWRDM